MCLHMRGGPGLAHTSDTSAAAASKALQPPARCLWWRGRDQQGAGEHMRQTARRRVQARSARHSPRNALPEFPWRRDLSVRLDRAIATAAHAAARPTFVLSARNRTDGARVRASSIAGAVCWIALTFWGQLGCQALQCRGSRARRCWWPSGRRQHGASATCLGSEQTRAQERFSATFARHAVAVARPMPHVPARRLSGLPPGSPSLVAAPAPGAQTRAGDAPLASRGRAVYDCALRQHYLLIVVPCLESRRERHRGQ